LSEQIYKIALTKIPKVGNKIGLKLLEHFGSAKNILQSTRKDLEEVFKPGDIRVSNILDPLLLSKAEEELKYIDSNGIVALFIDDKDYPRRLKEISDPPLILYKKGNVDLNQDRVISVVGTRHATATGLQTCRSFIEGLMDYDPLVISGLAFGVDACAHKSALDYGLATYGVVAHGLKDIYPTAHRNLARNMQSHGGLLTEFPSNVYAEKEFFPMRNRIVAGMCDALIVVETAAKGGSMISADLANAYYKDVFAFPGRPSDHYSTGCNNLIKENKAQMITSAADFATAMGWNQKKPLATQRELFEELEIPEKNVITLLRDHNDLNIDQLAIRAQMTNSQISAVLLQLEFKGLVQSQPGKRYSLV